MSSAVSCPNCSRTLSRADQRRMSPFWRGVQSITCAGCGAQLQWQPALQRRMKIGALLFKVGLAATLLSLILPALLAGLGPAQPFMFFGGLALAIVGILSTASRPGAAFVQATPPGA